MFWPFFCTVTPQSGLGGGYGPGGTWGLVELIAVIAGPLFLLCLLLLVGVFLYQYHRRAYSHRQRLDVEDPSCDHLYPAKDRTLQDLIFDLSTSGSGSGERTFTLPTSRFQGATEPHERSLVSSGQVCLCLSSGPWPEPSSCRKSSGKVALERCGAGAGGAATWR